jgi:hypothetical protein
MSTTEKISTVDEESSPDIAEPVLSKDRVGPAR